MSLIAAIAYLARWPGRPCLTSSPTRVEARTPFEARLDRLEQAIQPGGRFFVMRADPTQDLEDQIAAYEAENGVTARDILVIRQNLAPGWPEDQRSSIRSWGIPRPQCRFTPSRMAAFCAKPTAGVDVLR
jgi:hypothetical protein